MTSICFAMPCAGAVDPRTLQSVSNVAFATAARGVKTLNIFADQFQFGVISRTVIQSARNWLADEFLKTGAEWCFWMDSDMTFPPNAAIDLLTFAQENNVHFVSGVYYQRAGHPVDVDENKKSIPCKECGNIRMTHMPVVWRQDPIIKDREGNEIIRAYEDEYLHHFIFPGEVPNPFKAHVVGFGCVLTHRSVFERVPKPWFRFLALKGGKEASEDFYFCVNAKKAGIDLWVVPSVSCGHIADGPIITEKNCILDKSKMVEIKLDTIPENKQKPKYGLVEIKPKDKKGSAA